MIKKIWQTIPENKIKNKFRTWLYNYRAGKETQFSMEGMDFITIYKNTTIKTIDHPFNIPKDLNQYLSNFELKSGDVVLDAGAFRGHISLYFALLVGPTGQVVAFEPDEKNIEFLSKNLYRNDLENVKIERTLLWDKSEQILFCEQGNESSSAVWIPKGGQSELKQADTIDALVQKHNLDKVNFVKMDIEGAEIQALDGAVETIGKYKPSFAIASYHIVNGKPTHHLMEEALKNYGYQVKTEFFGKECITYGMPN